MSADAHWSTWDAAIDAAVAVLEPRLVEVRRYLHAHPEPSREERETSRFLYEQLISVGIAARLGRNGLGVLADLDIGSPPPETPRIALRADIDALRIPDTKQTPYASQHPGLCHACGHDAHSAIIVGAALAAAAVGRDAAAEPVSLPPLRLRFIFQPAEETGEGGLWMVEQGAVDDCAAILGCHVDPDRKLGTVGVRYGVLTANCDEVEVIVEGRGGHAARPHQTQDPIAAAAQLVTALFQFLPRSVDARSPHVFSVGRVCGGTLPNVIPPRVEILGSLRTLDRDVRQKLKDRIEAIVHGVKEVSGTSMHLRFFESIDSVINDPHVTSILEAAARAILGAEGIDLIPHPSMGGEDFSAYLTRVPGAMLRLGVSPPGFASPFLHSTDFDIDERALPLGVRILLRAAVRLTTHPPLVEPAAAI